MALWLHVNTIAGFHAGDPVLFHASMPHMTTHIILTRITILSNDNRE
jgi:hypothetical protein